MSCTWNGYPAVQQRPGLFIVAGQGVGAALAMNYPVTFEVVVEQFSINWSVAPVTSEDFQLWRDAFQGAAFDTVFRAEDPSLVPWTDFVCNEEYRFSIGDAIRLDYPNTDAATVSAVIWIRQVDN